MLLSGPSKGLSTEKFVSQNPRYETVAAYGCIYIFVCFLTCCKPTTYKKHVQTLFCLNSSFLFY